jgi:thiol:disulfide interchange protein DsbC
MKRLTVCSVLLISSAIAIAADPPAKSAPAPAAAPAKGTTAVVTTTNDIRVMLASKLPGAKPEDVHPTPVAGLYEISLGGSTGYITADGKFMLTGDLYEIDSKTNVTEARRSVQRAKELAKVADTDTIVFAPTGQTKHTVTVFTDVDCGYCRKLHSEMAEYNKLGIRIRYAAYPRQGPGSEAWGKMESVWCSKDRKDALTHAKLGEEPKSAKCATPVAKQFELGERMGVNGTPAIMTSDGDYITGYLPPAKLLAKLDSLQQEAQANAAKSKSGI